MDGNKQRGVLKVPPPLPSLYGKLGEGGSWAYYALASLAYGRVDVAYLVVVGGTEDPWCGGSWHRCVNRFGKVYPYNTDASDTGSFQVSCVKSPPIGPGT